MPQGGGERLRPRATLGGQPPRSPLSLPMGRGAAPAKNLLPSSGEHHAAWKNKPFAITHDQHKEKKKTEVGKSCQKKPHPSIIATIQRSQRLLLKGNFNTAKSLLCRNKQLQQTVMKDKAGRSQKDTSAWPPRLCSPDGTHTAAFEKPKFPLCFVFFSSSHPQQRQKNTI